MVKIMIEIDKKEGTVYWNGKEWCDKCRGREGENSWSLWGEVFGGLMNYVKDTIKEDMEDGEGYEDNYRYDKIGREDMVTVEISYGYDYDGTFHLDIKVDNEIIYQSPQEFISFGDLDDTFRELKGILMQKMGVEREIEEEGMEPDI